uniref:Sulfotransferase n=1 Tax=Callorhinchus milii TaxID=7868 RepID=A0A4W3ICQ4_CALMI
MALVRPQLKRAEGVPMIEFQARPDDLLIATFPKAGTTWMQKIVDFIYSQGDVEKCQRAPVMFRSPFLELFFPGVEPALDWMDSMPSPRIIKTHLPFFLLPKSFLEQDCKVNNLVSYYHFDKILMMEPEPGTWEEFFNKVITGNVGWGSWYDHVSVLSWLHCYSHCLGAEQISHSQNSKQEIMKVAKFLERDLSDQIIDVIVQKTSFTTMRDNPMVNYSTLPKEILDHSVFQFMRKGTSGQHPACPSCSTLHHQWPWFQPLHPETLEHFSSIPPLFLFLPHLHT